MDLAPIKTRPYGSHGSMGSTSFNDVLSSMGELNIDGSMKSCGEDYYVSSSSSSFEGGPFRHDNYQFPANTIYGTSSSQSNFQDPQEPRQPDTVGGNRRILHRRDWSGISTSGGLEPSFQRSLSTNPSQISEGRQRGEGRQRRSSRNDDSISEPHTIASFRRILSRKRT